jgi:hypothetical protein
VNHEEQSRAANDPVTATCEACRREADVNVDALPETMTVPKAGQRLRCSSCGGRTISTRPAWHTARRAGVFRFSAARTALISFFARQRSDNVRAVLEP